MRILHLSDMHFGADHAFAPDVSAAGGLSFADSLCGSLQNSSAGAIDLVLLSGDFFCREQRADAKVAIQALKQFFTKLFRTSDRAAWKTLAVPGNHDLTWS